MKQRVIIIVVVFLVANNNNNYIWKNNYLKMERNVSISLQVTNTEPNYKSVFFGCV